MVVFFEMQRYEKKLNYSERLPVEAAGSTPVAAVSIRSVGISSLKKRLLSNKRVDPNQNALKQGSSEK